MGLRDDAFCRDCSIDPFLLADTGFHLKLRTNRLADLDIPRSPLTPEHLVLVQWVSYTLTDGVSDGSCGDAGSISGALDFSNISRTMSGLTNGFRGFGPSNLGWSSLGRQRKAGLLVSHGLYSLADLAGISDSAAKV